MVQTWVGASRVSRKREKHPFSLALLAGIDPPAAYGGWDMSMHRIFSGRIIKFTPVLLKREILLKG